MSGNWPLDSKEYALFKLLNWKHTYSLLLWIVEDNDCIQHLLSEEHRAN